MSRPARVLLMVSIGTLLLLVVLSCFAHPMADDWSYAQRTRSQHFGAWYVGDYLHWNGRYFSNLFVGHNPLALGLDALWAYRCIPLALITFTVLAMRSVVSSVPRERLGSHGGWGIAVLLSALYFHGMPDIGEGLFWYTGAVTYQVGNILLLFLLARCIAHKSGWVSVLLVITIIGCSEVHMILVLVLLASSTGFDLSRQKHVSGSTWAALALGAVCACVVVLAPGNSVRGALFTGTHQVFHSGWMSLLQTLRFGATWLLDPALLVCSLLYFPLQRKWLVDHPDALRLPVWLTTAGLGAVIFLCAFPAYWGTGILGQHRTMNVAYCFFLLLWFANISAWDAALFRKKWPQWPFRSSTARALPFIAGVTLLFTGNTFATMRDLFTGRAARFDQQLMARYALLEQARADGSEPVLPLIQQPPEALPLHDLRTDSLDWLNQCYALYFGMKGRPVHRASPGDRAPSQP